MVNYITFRLGIKFIYFFYFNFVCLYVENQPIFGVPLEISFDRNPCHDEIHIPLILRNCIDYVQMNGKYILLVWK